MQADIEEFQGEYRWLSNFWPAKVIFDEVAYPSVEHAYQAAKTYPSERAPFLKCSAAEAKKLGRQVVIREEWEAIKLDVMKSLIEQKFAPGSSLAKRLLATGDARLVEGNKWGDTFWGVYKGRGQNHLGNILMMQRSRLQGTKPELEILEHSSSSYSPRTYVNASSADMTVALAVDLTTAGERLTHKAAGNAYLGINIKDVEPVQAARMLYKAMKERSAKSLNIAGNGMFTLARHGWTQERADDYVFEVIKKVSEHWKIDSIRSGGQTGVDLSGLIAAYALGIKATGLLPKGFIQRDADKADRGHTPEDVRSQIERGAAGVLSRAGASQSQKFPEDAHAFHQDGQAPSDGEVFVFGSNLAGRHGAGAALLAKQRFGAVYGQGIGRQGMSYAIPTKDGRTGQAALSDPRATLNLDEIKEHVQAFIEHARSRSAEKFFVTRVGCGLAGYKDEEIAPLFAGAPKNCNFPDAWRSWIVPSTKETQEVIIKDSGYIRVVSKRKDGTQPKQNETLVDGDRKNPILGNRHFLSDWKNPEERSRVIEKFRTEDFLPDLDRKGPIFQEIEKLAVRVMRGEKIALACWCAPLPCHCDLIAGKVNEKVLELKAIANQDGFGIVTSESTQADKTDGQGKEVGSADGGGESDQAKKEDESLMSGRKFLFQRYRKSG